MLLIFRSWKIGFLAMIPNVIPPAFGAAVMALASINYDVGTVLVMSVVMGIAVDDTIHFLTHYTEKTRHHGLAPIDAITEVFEETGLSLVLTTVILVVGFGVFALGEFTPSVNFGTMTAIALGLAIGADLCLLPAILMKKETVKSGVKT
jgi:predicted RND superfamily exporter protein